MMAMNDNSIPALVFCEARTGAIPVAALTLLDRLVVALHRGGCGRIQIVCTAAAVPEMSRAKALGIPVEVLRAAPKVAGPVLVAECRLLVQAADVRAVLQARGRMTDGEGVLLPFGVLDEFSGGAGEVEAALKSRPSVRATGVAGLVTDEESVRRMERRLWASLGSSSDGVVDTYFNRPLGRFLSKVLIHTAVTPNQVTVASGIIGLASAWFFAEGGHTAGIIGALLLQLAALVDCVDGDIARVMFKESPLGKWLDLALDNVVHVAVFATIAVGLSRAGCEAPVGWLGLSAVVGAVISFPVVVRARRLSQGELDGRLEKFIDAASTRDFTALIVFLAVLGRLEWFLWLTGITVHIFWITALALQWPKRVKNGSA